MTIETFQRFVETFCPSACVPVDLVKIARNVLMSNVGPRVDHEFRYQLPEIIPSPLCLVMDGECCLDRLYGGFFGDWVCGGQWNRMVDFLRTFFEVVNKRNIEITVFFNGAFESDRMTSWIEKQTAEKEKISQVLRHTTCKGTPPPKVWWVAPSGLRTCLRILLRHLKVNVVLTTDDHHQEVMSYLKKYNYHGLLADDPEYMIFDPPRYFSSVQLKLTFKGCLETKEYILNEVTRCLNLHPSRICIVAALLGNHIITDSDLASFHRSICPDSKGKVTPNALIKAIVDYVRNLNSVDDLDEVAWKVFGSHDEDRHEKFKQSVLYYCRGNRNNALQLSNISGNSYLVPELDNFDGRTNQSSIGKSGKSPLLPTPGNPTISNAGSRFQDNENSGKNTHMTDVDNDPLRCQSKFASETDESEMSSLQSIRKVLDKAKRCAYYSLIANQDDSDYDCPSLNYSATTPPSGEFLNSVTYKRQLEKELSNNKETFHDEFDDSELESTLEAMENISMNSNKAKKKNKMEGPPLPRVSLEVMRMARERHQKGLMHPYILQILSQGEIKIPVMFEDETSRELPSPILVYRPLRQMLYALLFNHHHLQYLSAQKKEKEGIDEKVPEIVIKEWVWSKSNKYCTPELVPSLPLGWPVPTVTRLWFGSLPEDNKKRLQAFLTCMRSNSPMMCDPICVPQHLILLCCVLRYLMSSPEMPFLYKHELDAFLVQAVDRNMMDTEHTQKLEVPLITTRGVMLAALFMQGVEHALLVNDACGAPISWLMCCPWLFFDGKIFHRKLLKANTAKNLLDLCDNRYDEVAAVEHMRSAIVEGLQVQFLAPQLPTSIRPPPHPPFPNFPVPQGRGRGHQRVVPRGGQLEVAGVVVGSWGPNYGQGPRSPSRSIPPQVVSVGGVGRGRAASILAARGFGPSVGQSSPNRNRNSSPSHRRSSPLRSGIGLHGANNNSPGLDFDL